MGDGIGTSRKRSVGAMVLPVLVAGLLVSCTGSDEPASPAPGTRSHEVEAPASVDGVDRPVSETVTLSFPAGWTTADAKAGQVALRNEAPACSYTITAAAEVVALDVTSATDAARSVVPTADGKLLESGRRGSAAWRVVKLHGDGERVRLDGVRAQPLRYLSSQADRPLWLVTRIQAESDAGDECHSGTYRVRVGPALGDALATARSRP